MTNWVLGRFFGLVLVFLSGACSDPEVGPSAVSLGADGGLKIALPGVDGVTLTGVTFRLQLGDGGWITAADFGAPTLSASGQQVSVSWSGSPAGGPSGVELRFSLPTGDSGAVGVQATLRAPSGKAVVYSAFELVVPDGGLQLPGLGGQLLLLQNGFQSWSYTGVLRLKAPFSSPLSKDAATALKAGLGDPTHELAGVSWWFGLLAPRSTGPSLVAGAATASRLRTAVLPSLPATGKAGLVLRVGTAAERSSIAPGKSVALEALVFAAATTPRAALAAYTAEVARRTKPLRAEQVADPTGWWSWNIFFEKITEKQLLDHAAYLRDNLKQHGFTMVELDDGYEQRWGDWELTDPVRFPSGLAGVAGKINKMGLSAGLWLAPFLVHQDSALVKDHAEWFVKGADGKLLQHQQMGVSGTMRVLDPTHPGAAAHLKGLFSRLNKAGFTLFKLDFLYAGALPGVRHQAGVSGLQALNLGLELVRQAAPSPAHINLCGMPLLPAVGRGHSVRTGADIAFSMLKDPGFVLLAHEARNVMLRGFLDPLVRNDPDQALLRAPLTDDEARMAATLAAMTGFYSSGDDLTGLPASRLAMLKNPDLLAMARAGRSAQAAGLLQAVDQAVIQSPVLDTGLALGDPRTTVPTRFYLPSTSGPAYLALFNWQSTQRTESVNLTDLGLSGVTAVRESWTKKPVSVEAGKLALKLKPHSVALLRITAR